MTTIGTDLPTSHGYGIGLGGPPPADPAAMSARDWNARFDWKPQPDAARLVDGLLAAFLERCAFAAALADRMRDETGTRFADWVTDISVADDATLRDRLVDAGFIRDPAVIGGTVLFHPGAMFPLVRLEPGGADRITVSIKVDAVVDFLAAHQLPIAGEIEGGPGERHRTVLVTTDGDAWLRVVEQHGGHWLRSDGRADASAPRAAAAVLERFRTRRRRYGTPDGAPSAGPTVPSDNPAGVSTADIAFDDLDALVDRAVAEVGQDWACDLFFEAERLNWMSRNRAARVQYERQQRLGLGWANHDHHTYRCSRRNFHRVVRVLEKLGMQCRERFYAGREAGWGAQVLEQPRAGFVVFADVDMSAEEIDGDFSHRGFATPLGDSGRLGTVGLWVALHGESLFEAGMHHLECQFDHERLTEQLARSGVGMMHRFTDFDFLTQAFTEGERWPVEPWRLERLVGTGLLTRDEADRFAADGALGSHLENLERNDGFKGFNQHGVSDIITRTDARHA